MMRSREPDILRRGHRAAREFVLSSGQYAPAIASRGHSLRNFAGVISTRTRSGIAGGVRLARAVINRVSARSVGNAVVRTEQLNANCSPRCLIKANNRERGQARP